MLETNASISIDKNTHYAELVNKITPFTASTNKMERKTAYDINYLLHFAINENKNPVLIELKSGIENVINYFTKEINDLINQTVSWIPDMVNVHYQLLNDIVRVITQTLLHKSNVAKFNNYLLNM